MESYLEDETRTAKRALTEALAVARKAQMPFEGALAQHLLETYVDPTASRQESQLSRSSVAAHFGCSDSTRRTVADSARRTVRSAVTNV